MAFTQTKNGRVLALQQNYKTNTMNGQIHYAIPITREMVIEAAKAAAENFCKTINSQYTDESGNLRNSVAYTIQDDKIIIIRGMEIVCEIVLSLPPDKIHHE